MRIFTVAAVCVAMGLLVTNCSDTTVGAPDTSSTGAGGDSAAAVIDNFCNSLVVPYCEAATTCCKSMVAPPFADLDLCEKGFLVYSNSPAPYCWKKFVRDVLATNIRTGAVVFDPERFDTCLSELKALSAGGAACTKPTEVVLETICIGAFRGQIAPGEACLWDESDFFGSVIPCKDGRCEEGKCVPFLKAGDPCESATIYDTASTFCNYVREEACKFPPPDAGGGGAGGNGGGGAGGGGGGAALIGTCGPKGDAGDTCYGGDEPEGWRECQSLSCDETAHCVLPSPVGTACFNIP